MFRSKDLPELVLQFLSQRGFKSEEDIERFLFPKLSQVPDPKHSLKDLDIAVKRLREARDRGEPIVVFGDYDVDGATSTALLVSALRELGWTVGNFIPHRVEEGYGLSIKGVQRMLRENPTAKVVITCDCGISSYEGIEYLNSQSIDVIVTDHHEPPSKRVPALAVINPKQQACDYPDKLLAGVGVAFLLLIGLRQSFESSKFPLGPYLDLVALGTVCDMAELRGANRIFVKAGLSYIRDGRRPGIRAIAEAAGVELFRTSARDLGFSLGPRLNAVGRMGDPRLGYETLIEEDFFNAQKKAQALESLNRQRRSLQEEQTKEAEAKGLQLLKKSPNRRSLVLTDSSFHLGLVGLIASRLVEKFKRPVCVLTKIDDEHELANFVDGKSLWKGSLRSPSGVHLAQILDRLRQNQPELLRSAGGHAVAAGVALEEERLEEFDSSFEEEVSRFGVHKESLEYDIELSSWEALSELIDLVEPTGNGNPPPRFLIKDFELAAHRVMKEKHLKLQGKLLGRNCSILQFNSPWVKILESLQGRSALRLDLTAEAFWNYWNGNKSLEFQLKDLLELKEGETKHALHYRKDEIIQSQSPAPAT